MDGDSARIGAWRQRERLTGPRPIHPGENRLIPGPGRIWTAPAQNGVATSSSPFQSLYQGDEDIASPSPFPKGAVSGCVHPGWRTPREAATPRSNRCGAPTNLTYRARPGNYGSDFAVTGIAGSHCTLAVNWTANRIEVLPDPRRPFLVSSAHAAPALPSIRLRGLAGQSHTVESSTDLVQWTLVGTFLGSTDEVEIPGSGPDQTSARFYRLAP